MDPSDPSRIPPNPQKRTPLPTLPPTTPSPPRLPPMGIFRASPQQNAAPPPTIPAPPRTGRPRGGDPNYHNYESSDYNWYLSGNHGAGKDYEKEVAELAAGEGAGNNTLHPNPSMDPSSAPPAQGQQEIVWPPEVQRKDIASLKTRASLRARRFISKNKVPAIEGWDWLPFMQAMFERDTQVPLNDEESPFNYLDPDADVDEDDDYDPDATEPEDEGGGGGDPLNPNKYGLENRPSPIPSTLEPNQRKQTHQPRITNKLPPPKQLGDGSWLYAVYIPEWCDPAWDPNWEHVYGTDRKRPRVYRDVLQSLRPALRADDAVRNPTPYARRWGIPSDRTDGRSRTSPTFSRTRDYGAGVDDKIMTQIMDEATRTRCLAATRQLIAEGKTQYRGEGIAPEIMDSYRRHAKIPSQEEIRTGAVRAGIPFERYIEKLPQNVRDLYSNLISDVLEDEDYQRVLFYDMTSDEMYRNNIYTMSNDETYNLTEIPLHPLLGKNKWESTLHKGAEKEYPRLVYDFWGKREEYDVHRNPMVWAAIQPALQLVTRVLQTDPPLWRSIRDLRTRRKVDPRLDPRSAEDSRTPYLQKMIRQDEIKQPGDQGYQEDLDDRWEAIETIASHGFDFTYHVDRLTLNHLEFSFGTGCMDEEGKPTNFEYGRTTLINAGLDSKIQIAIAAELVWPLLIPIYSSSEKLCASYVLATTILHELMHATCYSVDIMCARAFGLYHPKQTRDISIKLHDWWNIATDMECGRGEPWWRNDLRCEVGWAFEKDFWGDSAILVTGGTSSMKMSQNITSLPLALVAERHHTSTLATGYDTLRGHYPVEDYYRPISIDYYAKFFQDAFWDVEWPRHGFAAFKRLPPERQNLCLMLPTWYPERAMQDIFGSDNWRFFRIIIRSLRRFGHPIMAEYLNQLVWKVRGFHSLRNRWLIEANHWLYADEEWTRLLWRVADATDRLTKTWVSVSAPDDELYSEWVANKPDPKPDRAQWCQIMQNDLLELTREGGVYFTEIEAMHRMAADELRLMERMVYEFLTVRKGQRKFIYRPEANEDPLIQLVNRMAEYKERLEETHDQLDDLQTYAPLAAEADRITAWCAWLDQDARRLEHLCNLVLSEWQIDNDEAQKQRELFNTVPTALYEKRANRLRKLAMKEYTALDPRIRVAVDEMYKKVEFWVKNMSQQRIGLEIEESSMSGRDKVIALQKRLNKSNTGGNDSLGKPLGSVMPKKSNNIFSFKKPGSMRNVAGSAVRRTGGPLGTPAGVSKKGETTRGSRASSVFGRSGFADAMPRRTTGPKASHAAATAFARYTHVERALGNAPPKFQGNFANQVNVVTPPPAGLPLTSSFGPVPMAAAEDPFGSTNSAMMGQTPFPYPYADRNMVTSDLQYLTQNPSPAMQHLINSLQISQGTFREPPKEDEDDTIS
ncbi:hypothetical protein PG987_010986 [Apiospora arundinis]